MVKLFYSREKNVYQKPDGCVHRRFVYLDDDIVINSLSAFESGKVDEVVEKINLAQDRGLQVNSGTGLSGGASSSDSLQAEVIRRRTRFSVFELWYESLKAKNSSHGRIAKSLGKGSRRLSGTNIGKFEGWGGNALTGVEPGHTVELRGQIEIVPLQTLFRAFLWFVREVGKGNSSLFDEEQLTEELKKAEKVIRSLLGERSEINATFIPVGEKGPEVGLTFLEKWVIESIGKWSGTFTLVAQVEEILEKEQTWQTMRIIEEVPLTTLEERTLRDSIEHFRPNAAEFGLDFPEDLSEVTQMKGPALILRPIALFR